jgi:hypothetical protein
MANRIDASLSAANKNQVLQLIQDIKNLLPFLLDISQEEFKSLPKMGDKSRAFVSQALALAEQDDSFLPRSFDVAEMRKDVELTEALLPILTAMSSLTELLEDTYKLAGSEAYVSALLVYQSAKANGKGSALDGSLDALGQRFSRKSRGKSVNDSPNS